MGRASGQGELAILGQLVLDIAIANEKWAFPTSRLSPGGTTLKGRPSIDHSEESADEKRI